MRDESYESKLAKDIELFVAQKRACGYPYVESATILRRFDRMVAERFPDDTAVTKGACDAWLSLVEDEHPNELMRRVSPVRQLAKYVAASGRPSYIIPSGIPGKRLKYQAHIFTPGELSAFFGAVDVDAVPHGAVILWLPEAVVERGTWKFVTRASTTWKVEPGIR